MRRRELISVFALWSYGDWAFAAGDTNTLAVIVNPKNPTQALSSGELEAIFTTRKTFWDGGARILAFNLKPKTPHRVAFDREVLHMTPDQVARYWIDRRVRGGAPPPRTVPDAALVQRVVAKLPGAVGYVPESLLASGVKVVAEVKFK